MKEIVADDYFAFMDTENLFYNTYSSGDEPKFTVGRILTIYYVHKSVAAGIFIILKHLPESLGLHVVPTLMWI